MSLYETVPQFFSAVDAGALYGVTLIVGVVLIFGLIDLIRSLVYRVWYIARCQGFHNHSIEGGCRCHGCPYSRQCEYHLPRRSFRRWWSDIRFLLMFHLRRGKVVTSKEWTRVYKKEEP